MPVDTHTNLNNKSWQILIHFINIWLLENIFHY